MQKGNSQSGCFWKCGSSCVGISGWQRIRRRTKKLSVLDFLPVAGGGARELRFHKGWCMEFLRDEHVDGSRVGGVGWVLVVGWFV